MTLVHKRPPPSQIILSTIPIIALNFHQSLLETYPVDESNAAGPAE